MNCKPGDLAYIVDSVFPENIGRIVEVLSPAGLYWGNFEWNCRARTHLKGVEEITERVMTAKEGCIPDECLRPISGVPVHDEVTEEITA